MSQNGSANIRKARGVTPERRNTSSRRVPVPSTPKKIRPRAPKTSIAVRGPSAAPKAPLPWKSYLAALAAIVGASNEARRPDTGVQLAALALLAIVAVVAVARSR